MKPMFAVQFTDRDDTELHKTVDALKSARLDYELFGLIHHSDDVTNLESFPTDRPVIPLGSTKMLGLYLKGKLPSNWKVIYATNAFDQQHYANHYKSALLNHDAKYEVYGNTRGWCYPQDVFVKPVNDLKVFGGFILEAHTTLDEALAKTSHAEIDPYEKLLFAPAINLYREFRLFVVDGEIVDASEYRNKGQIKHRKVSEDTGFKLQDYFQSVKDPNAPSMYALDIGEVDGPDGIVFKVIELNCFHCSGMYECDQSLVYQEVAHYVGHMK